MPNQTEVPVAVREALMALLEPRPMRRGSLSERYMKCNKPGCPCSQDPKGRHGPYFSLTRGIGGSTFSRLVSGDQARVARLQVDAAQQFRKDIERYWRACETWADAQLEATEVTSQEADLKKGASKKPSMRKSPRKS
jgi:hypothetical protein